MRKRLLLKAVAAWLAMTGAHAQDPVASAPPADKYVVMSLIGNELTFSNSAGAGNTGSNIIHRNTDKVLPTTGDAWDVAAMIAVNDSLKSILPQAQASFLKGTSPDFFSNQGDWFDGDRLRLPAGLEAAIRGENGTYLLLLTKLRGEAVVSDGADSHGKGALSGLGFYTDDHEGMLDRGQITHGFTAPFVYVKLTLVDLSTMKIVRSLPIQATVLGSYHDYSTVVLRATLTSRTRAAVRDVLRKPA
jgi:hypothetical protein